MDFTTKTFVPGTHVQGKITYPGYEHLTMDVLIESVVPQRLLSFRWHPAAIDPTVDYSNEPTTLVVFELEEVQGGTMLLLMESGLDQIPPERRATVFRLNCQGWSEQMENIQKHVAKA